MDHNSSMQWVSTLDFGRKDIAPVWILFSLPHEFLEEETLEGICNVLVNFVKISKATKFGRYTSHARIHIYMKILKLLPVYVNVSYQSMIWKQTIDYEHIPYFFRKFHEYDYLSHNFPLNSLLRCRLLNPPNTLKISRSLPFVYAIFVCHSLVPTLVKKFLLTSSILYLILKPPFNSRIL